MYKMMNVILAGASLLMLAACSGDDDNGNVQPQPQTENIVETARAAGSFSTLLTALEATGLDSVLSGTDSFTVFAPTDAAFAALPAGTLDSLLQPENAGALADILTYHVVGGEYRAAAVLGSSSLTSVFGQSLAIESSGGPMIGNSKSMALITGTDIEASNGLIHVIDTVLLPLDIVDIAAGNSDFSTLVTALTAADLVETLQGTGPFTVFAPTDAAFAALPAGTLDSLLLPENKDTLIDILTYHVAPGGFRSELLTGQSQINMVNGDNAGLSLSGSSLLIDGATVSTPDIIAANGVIHIINQVILPPQ